MRGVSLLGTRSATSATYATFPPSPPVMPTVNAPRSWAASMPRTTFALVPEVERPTATSPGRQSASSWRANTSSNAPSFATAVSSAPSVVRAIEARPGTVDEVAADELGGEVLALRGTSAVAEPEDGAAARASDSVIRSATRSMLGHQAHESRHDHLMVVDSLLDVQERLSTGALLCLRLATG